MAGPESRRISVNKLLDTHFVEMDVEGEWKDGLGEKPEMSGIWFTWGGSGNGKTYGSMKMAKYLTNFSNVIWWELEEGKRKTTQRALAATGMREVARKFHLYDRTTSFEKLKDMLRSRKSPSIVFVNSFQYLALTKKQYLAFKAEFGTTHLIIFLSHAEGRQPEGKVAKFVRFDADIKIWCEGFKFFPSGRYGGGKEIVIDQERADKYWDEQAA